MGQVIPFVLKGRPRTSAKAMIKHEQIAYACIVPITQPTMQEVRDRIKALFALVFEALMEILPEDTNDADAVALKEIAQSLVDKKGDK